MLTETQKEEMMSLLGKVPDKELAAQFNISPPAIYHWRKKMHIPSCITRKSFLNHAKLEQVRDILSLVPGEKIAQQLGISKTTVYWHRQAMKVSEKNPEIIGKLGIEHDKAIAREYDINIDIVKTLRGIHGIPPCRKRKQLIKDLEKYIDVLASKRKLDIATQRRLSRSFSGKEANYINIFHSVNKDFRNYCLSLELPDQETEDDRFYTDLFYSLIKNKQWNISLLNAILESLTQGDVKGDIKGDIKGDVKGDVKGDRLLTPPSTTAF
jgi:DNA-binding CsgD family transcriptional regulator